MLLFTGGVHVCPTAQVVVIGQLGEYVLWLLPCGFWGTELRYLGTLACYAISLALASPLFFSAPFPFPGASSLPSSPTALSTSPAPHPHATTPCRTTLP